MSSIGPVNGDVYDVELIDDEDDVQEEEVGLDHLVDVALRNEPPSEEAPPLNERAAPISMLDHFKMGIDRIVNIIITFVFSNLGVIYEDFASNAIRLGTSLINAYNNFRTLPTPPAPNLDYEPLPAPSHAHVN